jgi:hypothetical protein
VGVSTRQKAEQRWCGPVEARLDEPMCQFGSADRLTPSVRAGRQILGMEVYSKGDEPSDVIAARLVLPNQVHRPGALVFTGDTPAAASAKLPPPFQVDGSLGSWGWFEQGSPPKVETIGGTEGTVTLRGALRVVKATGSTGGMVAGGSPTWG